MRWLWNLGGRYAAQRLWQRVSSSSQKSTEHASSSPSDDDSAAAPVGKLDCRLVVLCSNDRVFAAFSDAMPWKQQTHADGFRVQRGKLAGCPIAIAFPTREPVETGRIVSALVDAHAPRFLVWASEGTSAKEEVGLGSVVVATRVLGPSGESIKLDAAVPPREGLHTGAVVSRLENVEDAMAIEPFSWAVAKSCIAKQIPLMVAVAIAEPCASQQTGEVTLMKQQRSLAGQAGVVSGLLWKRRDALKKLWQQKQATWQGRERLVKLVTRIAPAD